MDSPDYVRVTPLRETTGLAASGFGADFETRRLYPFSEAIHTIFRECKRDIERGLLVKACFQDRFEETGDDTESPRDSRGDPRSVVGELNPLILLVAD